jgi:uncharacterized membrane protein YdjX (TVP38/TMEM64 family)
MLAAGPGKPTLCGVVARAPRRLGAALRVGALVGLVGGGALLFHYTAVGGGLRDLARDLGHAADEPWAAPAYVGLYGLALAVGSPGTLLTIIGGVAFGVPRGLGVNLAGALLGASVAFFEGRGLARDAAHRLFGRHLAKLPDLAPPRTAVWAFFRLRLIPLVPFNVLNFAAGLTETRFLPYLAGTALGILPSTTLYTWFAAELAHGASAEALWAVGAALTLFCLLGIAPTVVRGLRRT